MPNISKSSKMSTDFYMRSIKSSKRNKLAALVKKVTISLNIDSIAYTPISATIPT